MYKRIISVFFAVILLLSCFSVGLISFAAESETVNDKAADTVMTATATEPTAQMTAGEKIKSFSFSKMIADVKNAAGNLNFIPWYTLYAAGRACDADGVEHIDEGWDNIIPQLKATGTSFGEFCAQYAAVMTNWAYTMAAIVGIIILLLKKNKKWWWYLFLVITAVMSVTSVGMHTADYGEFARYTMTTKLLASYIDMSFTELMAWSGCLCFVFEFYDTRPKQKKAFTIGITVWAAVVLAVLTFEVFVLNNRFLWIGGRGADGLPYDMGGDHGGLSLAEFGCFLTVLPLAYVLISNFKRLEKSERGIVVLLLATFAIAFVITSIWGDNEINSIAQGNFHGHSLWHLLTAMGTIIAAIWADHRTTEQKHKKEIELAVQKALAEQK